MSLLVLSNADVDHVVSKLNPSILQVLMARVFKLISSPTQSPPAIVAPHRTSISMENYTALFMPARISDAALKGTTLKAVCVPRNSNDTRGLAASTIVIDEMTGAAKALVNARGLTALRNAAGSLLSTNIVGLRKPTTIVAFGAGKQIEAHLALHLQYFPSVTSCTIVNRSLNARIQTLVVRLEAQFPNVKFHVTVRCTSPCSGSASNEAQANESETRLRSTVLAASLIICATPSTNPLFPSSWVRTGTHVILIGSYTPAMHEVDRDLIHRAITRPDSQLETGWPLLLVDSREACAIEAGELIDASVTAEEMVEIGERVKFENTGELTLLAMDHDYGVQLREPSDHSSGSGIDVVENTKGPITIFKSVGVGLQDVAIACAVVEIAEEMGLGTMVDGYDA